MAFLRQNLVEDQLIKAENALSDLSSRYNVATMKNELKAQIDRLRSQEEKFLRALGANSLDDINNRIKQYKAVLPQIQNLSGPDLYWSFLNSIEASQEIAQNEEQRRFIEYFSQVPEASQWVEAEDFRRWFQGLMNSVAPGVVSATHGYEQASSFEQVIVKKLTKAQKIRLEKYMKQNKKQDKTMSVFQEGNLVYTTCEFQDWAKITNNEKQSLIQEKLDKGLITKKELDDMLRKIYNLIVSKGPNDKLFRQSVGEVIFQSESKTKVFYGGNMMNGITGLLGEIQALFFIKCLLRSNGANPEDVSWIGGINNPHEDLLLSYAGEQIGIQVKNAYKDIEKIGMMEDISFMTRAATSFDQIKDKMGTDYNDIISIYEMDAFNIEYIIEDGVYKAGSNDVFAPTRQNIEVLSQQADRIMALFSGALMYMATGEEFSGLQTGNSVYFLGGAVMKFASEILLSIFQKLENMEDELAIKITSYFNKGASGVGNIVDYFNSNKSSRGNSVTGALGQLFLSSSYTFSL